MVGRKGLVFIVAAGALAACLLGFFSAGAQAAAQITVTPNTGLTDGASVSVSVSGFSDGPGAFTECNNATGQPTIPVAGNDVPVSCTNPFNNLQNVAGGVFSGKVVVHTGVVGPPAQGNDSAGKSAAADAALYPCPPTAAQVAAGATCIIAFGNANKEQATANIAFAGAAATTSPTASGSATTAAPTTAAPTTAASAATTPTTAATQVLGNSVTNPAAGSPPPGQVATTGSGPLTWALAIAGLVALDLGWLTFSSTRSPRGVLWRRRREVVPKT